MGVLLLSLLQAGVAAAAAAVDAAKPASVVTPAQPWPVAVVDRPLTLPRGMAAVSLASQSYWSPGAPARSYFGPAVALALHDRVELSGGLPFAFCLDTSSGGCAGSAALDRAHLGLAFALRRREGLGLIVGAGHAIERFRAPFQQQSSIWLTGKRTWFHRLALLGSAQLAVGWEHPVRAPVTPADPPVLQLNQTRLYWTEEVVWQVVERVALFAYGNPYRPLGAPGDESWATRVGGGATLAIGSHWQLAVECEVENIMPVRQWQYVPYGKGCQVSASVFHLPE